MSDPSTETLRVVHVEDDPVHRMIFERTAARLGGAVEVVGTASTLAGAGEVVAALEGAPDVVCLDLTLPDSALEETLAALPDLAVRWGTRIIATSALDDAGLPARVRAAGAGAFLPKDGLSVEALRAQLWPGSSGTEASGSGAAPSGGSEAGEDPAPHAAAAAPDPPPAQAVAARLMHDVRSWISAGKFRLAAVRRAETLEEALQHTDAIAETYDAIAAAVAAARETVVDETSALDLTRAEATRTAREAVQAWRRRAGDAAGRIEVAIEGSTGPVGHDRVALVRAIDALLDNALHHAAGGAGDVHLRIEGRPAALVVTDDGGPWDVAEPARLGAPASPGRRGTPRPGMGLYRARRLMERMGGGLSVGERADAAGSHSVKLEFGPARG